LDPRLRRVVVEDPNPALRRNLAVAQATGTILAFLDDDAFAAPDWIETAGRFLVDHPGVVALGGPDPPPEDSGVAELLADTLLATPWLGSGVLCHLRPDGVREIRSPSDLALVNLFVRRSAFEGAGGFDPSIGYVGEDTDLLGRLLRQGRVLYHSGVVVRHRRRAFPIPYLRQRWRYRVKTGALLVRGRAAYVRNPRILAFLAAGIAFLALAVWRPRAAALALLFHSVVTFALGSHATRLAPRFWALIPIGFLAHHAVYFAGITAGGLRTVLGRR